MITRLAANVGFVNFDCVFLVTKAFNKYLVPRILASLPVQGV